MDVDSVTAVGSCQVVLAVIGTGWLDAADERGRRRLDDPDDFVALEIKAGLDRDIPVIPVLIDGAPGLRRNKLRAALASLARRQSLRVDHDSFTADVTRLLTAVERTFSPTEEPGRGVKGRGVQLGRPPAGHRGRRQDRAAVGIRHRPPCACTGRPHEGREGRGVQPRR
jgi:hypothetical protein